MDSIDTSLVCCLCESSFHHCNAYLYEIGFLMFVVIGSGMTFPEILWISFMKQINNKHRILCYHQEFSLI